VSGRPDIGHSRVKQARYGEWLSRPPWRTLVLLLAILAALGCAYWIWSPGERVLDGRDDRRENGIWLQHAWLGDDAWFRSTGKDKGLFRSDTRIRELASLLSEHGVRYVFPHLCPCTAEGRIAAADEVQTERFLDEFTGFQVVPWVGGVLDGHCSPESPVWRSNFVASVSGLLSRHPRLAGIHVNIEPMPSGNADFLALLDEMRRGMPGGKLLSVAAYPPPTWLHPLPEVHWEESYFREVAHCVDQVVPMMYDTAIRFPKVYQGVMSVWTREVLEWSGATQVLLGVPAYDDAGTGYHQPDVEGLPNAIRGIHGGLGGTASRAANYRGIAIYCEWEMDALEWEFLGEEFEKR
jgi:hypothetical protein